jgi:hypothetical protein
MTAVVVAQSGIHGALDASTLVYLDGEIDQASPQVFMDALHRIHGGAIRVALNSPGGNVAAAMQLGRLIRRSGASTSIGVYVSGSSRPKAGYCISACALAFVGGLYRYHWDGSAYGVHRMSNTTGRHDDDLEVGQIVSAVVAAYLRDMGVNPRLFDLMATTPPDQVHVLTEAEETSFAVMNNGRQPSQWTIEAAEAGLYLQGVQETVYGTGKAIFTCNRDGILFLSAYQARSRASSLAGGDWEHSLIVNGERLPLPAPFSLKLANGYVSAMFSLTPAQLAPLFSATSVGHAMQASADAPSFNAYIVDIHAESAARFRDFLGNCLKRH